MSRVLLRVRPTPQGGGGGNEGTRKFVSHSGSPFKFHVSRGAGAVCLGRLGGVGLRGAASASHTAPADKQNPVLASQRLWTQSPQAAVLRKAAGAGERPLAFGAHV